MLHTLSEEEFNKAVGNRIKSLRDSHGWSLRELAERIGSTKQSVFRWENGQQCMSARSFYLMLEAFNISYDEFFNNI